MGFTDFFKKIFNGDEAVDEELRAARERHGIAGDDSENKDDKLAREEYDPWDEVRNARTQFYIGSWATKKHRIIGEDKLKADLEALEKKKQQKEAEEKKQG
jgi:hypothetical protein